MNERENDTLGEHRSEREEDWGGDQRRVRGTSQ